MGRTAPGDGDGEGVRRSRKVEPGGGVKEGNFFFDGKLLGDLLHLADQLGRRVAVHNDGFHPVRASHLNGGDSVCVVCLLVGGRVDLTLTYAYRLHHFEDAVLQFRSGSQR